MLCPVLGSSVLGRAQQRATKVNEGLEGGCKEEGARLFSAVPSRGDRVCDGACGGDEGVRA